MPTAPAAAPKVHRFEVFPAPGRADPRGERVRAEAAAIPLRLDRIDAVRVYLVEGDLDAEAVRTLGCGLLADTVVDRAAQARLSRNIVMSHACGVGSRLGIVETRAIMAAQVANLAHGRSGVRREVIEQSLGALPADDVRRLTVTNCAQLYGFPLVA